MMSANPSTIISLEAEKTKTLIYLKQISKVLEKAGNEKYYQFVNDEINSICDRLVKKPRPIFELDSPPEGFIWQDSFALAELRKIYGDISIPKLRTKADSLAKYFNIQLTSYNRNHVEELIFWFEKHWITFLPLFQIPDFENYLNNVLSGNESSIPHLPVPLPNKNQNSQVDKTNNNKTSNSIDLTDLSGKPDFD